MHARWPRAEGDPTPSRDAQPLTGPVPVLLFDPTLADEAVVERQGSRWVIRVRRFTGDVLASAPLHVEGEFASVLKLATRLLHRWHVTYRSSADWRPHFGTWVAPLHVYDPAATVAPVKL